MPDYGGRPAEENERNLETASSRDPPLSNYAIQMLERSLPSQQLPQQQHQQQSGGRIRTGGIMPRDNYKGVPVELRIPKWVDSKKLWINSEHRQAAQYNGDAMRYFTGQPPFHFPDAKFTYLPLLLSTGEELTTREKCALYVAKIAKDPALDGQRRDFKERAQKLILEMVKTPEVVQFLSAMRELQPLPEANTEDTEDENGTAMEFDTPSEEAIETDSPFTEGENRTAMEADTSSGESIQALASTATVDPSQCGSFVPAAEDIHFLKADDSLKGEEEHETPMEVDSLSVGAYSYYMDFDKSKPFFASFELDLNKPGNHLTSADLSLRGFRPRPGQKAEDVVPDNFKELFALLDKREEESWNSTGPSDWDPYRPPPPFVHQSSLLNRGTTSGADAAHEALLPPVCPIWSDQMEIF